MGFLLLRKLLDFDMEDQKKRILKASFGFLLVVTFLVVSGELFESYLKSLFSGNKIVTLIVVVPFALYFFKKIEQGHTKLYL